MATTEDRFSNAYISKMLKEVAAAYEVKGEDKFRIRAYQNAAASIEHATSDVKDLWEQGKLKELPGIGASLEGHLDEYFKTGKVKHFEQVLRPLPKGMFGLLGVHGIGAKTAYKLAREFKISNKSSAIKKVEKAAEEGKIRELEGFGEAREVGILEAVKESKPNKSGRERLLLPVATELAEGYIRYMRECDAVERLEPLGSLRRRVATIGDVDLAVSTEDPGKVIRYFISYEKVKEVLNEGDVKASVLLYNGVRVDLETESPDGFGALLQHFTGSKSHNIALRKLALEKGYSLSEHGIKYGKAQKRFATEEEFYSFIGLSWIPPEIREGGGEIDAASSGTLPKLVELGDLKGDLHVHTDRSDGANTLQDMVAGAKSLGHEYLGVADHAPSVEARGRAEVERLIREVKGQIEYINNSEKTIRVLFGYEISILADATVSMDEGLLSMLDYGIGGIHTSFGQDRQTITKRILSAIQNPYIQIISHPTARLLNERPSCDVDWEAVFKETLEKNKILEINAYPNRLDLPDSLVREAVKKGVKLCIGSDSHSLEHLRLLRYGIDVARRGWATKENIVNTFSYDKLLKVLEKSRKD